MNPSKRLHVIAASIVITFFAMLTAHGTATAAESSATSVELNTATEVPRVDLTAPTYNLSNSCIGVSQPCVAFSREETARFADASYGDATALAVAGCAFFALPTGAICAVSTAALIPGFQMVARQARDKGQCFALAVNLPTKHVIPTASRCA